jgi:hypothetical protein
MTMRSLSKPYFPPIPRKVGASAARTAVRDAIDKRRTAAGYALRRSRHQPASVLPRFIESQTMSFYQFGASANYRALTEGRCRVSPVGGAGPAIGEKQRRARLVI